MKQLANIVWLAVAFLITQSAAAQDEECVRTGCSVEERDARGCCIKKKPAGGGDKKPKDPKPPKSKCPEGKAAAPIDALGA
jgi:hypothetical protein